MKKRHPHMRFVCLVSWLWFGLSQAKPTLACACAGEDPKLTLAEVLYLSIGAVSFVMLVALTAVLTIRTCTASRKKRREGSRQRMNA